MMYLPDKLGVSLSSINDSPVVSKKNRRKSMSQRIELPVIDDDDDDNDNDDDDDDLDAYAKSNEDNDDKDEEVEGSSPNQCLSGEHVCDAIQIHKCACVVSPSEREKYDSCLVDGRFVLLHNDLANLISFL